MNSGVSPTVAGKMGGKASWIMPLLVSQNFHRKAVIPGVFQQSRLNQTILAIH